MTDERRDRGETAELLRSAVQEKVQELNAQRRPFTRRHAYLAIWGVVYLAVGAIFLATTDQPSDQPLIEYGFILAGGVSVASSIFRRIRLDILAFTLLSAVAAARGFWSIVHPEYTLVLSALAACLWLGVAGAQVVVAGWPTPPFPRGSPSRNSR